MPGTLVATYLFTAAAAGTWYYVATAFAVNLLASAVIAKAYASDGPNTNDQQNNPNPGSRLQLPPAGDNKLPVVYGKAYVGGIVTDLSITSNNQRLFYVIALCEVTNTETGGSPDTITFGEIYWGGKRCIRTNENVTALADDSTGTTDTSVNGKLKIYLYRNGSYTPTNSSLNAIQVMQTAGLVYTWDNTKLMSNCAFAIIDITYNAGAGLTGLQQTKFEVTNSRTNVGSCFLDYLTSTRYGAAIDVADIDTTSLTALNTYSNGAFAYTPYAGGSATQARFKFDGTVDTNSSIMQNLQLMSACCDCLIKYNEISGKWGVIVQSPTYTVAMALSDSNIVSAISITPTDLASSYNIAEVKYPDSTNQDSFTTCTLNLAVVNPALLYTNEPVNKQTISLPLVNNNVRAQYLANRFLENAREDLLVVFSINYEGLQLEAGDIVTVTNTNYGWTAKLFRINRVTEIFGSDASIRAELQLSEFNPAVFDDKPITQFTPAPNTGISYPTFFGTLPVPVVGNELPYANVPSFDLTITTSSTGIVQYAEIWYSAYASPTSAQRIFLTTTENQAGSTPYGNNVAMPAVAITTLPQGDWYFFSRMVNELAKSAYSSASALYSWRPRTFQYTNRWIAVAYATSANGATGFSTNPRNKTYYGLLNNTTANGSPNYQDYTWYLAPQPFGTDNYLLFANRTSRRFSFSVGNAGYANLNGGFVPTETSIYDASVWNGLPDGSNYIDLDSRTGQLVTVGTTAQTSADGLVSVTNSTSGTMVVALQRFLNFGAGIYTKTANAATLTIDIYGRVVGFTEQDNFYFTETVFSATAAQTTFSVTHIVGQILVFRNGVLLATSEYTETSTTVVMATACAVGEIIVIYNMRAVSTDPFYDPMQITVATTASNSVTYNNAPYQIIKAGDKLTFGNTLGTSTITAGSFVIATTYKITSLGTTNFTLIGAASNTVGLVFKATGVGTGTGTAVTAPAEYTVSTINTSTKTITFTTTIIAPAITSIIYRYRAAGEYTPFSRYEVDLTAVSSFLPTAFGINNGAEMLFVNGSALNEIDYDLAGDGSLTGFPSTLTGKLIIIQYANNNLGVPCSNIINLVAYSVASQLTYSFASNALSMGVYANGAILTKGGAYDYTATDANWILNTAFTNNSTLLNQQSFARIGAA